MLEQIVVDATALKEVAIKNAEAAIVEKYSEEIKEAVETLLEQPEEEATEEDLFGALDVPEEGALGGEIEEDPTIDDIPPAALDGEKLCPCPDEGKQYDVKFTDLMQGLDDEGGEAEEMLDREEEAEEILATEGDQGHSIELDDEYLEEVISAMSHEQGVVEEKLTIDFAPTKSGWSNTPSEDIKFQEALALAKSVAEKAQEEAEETKKENDTLYEKIEKINGQSASLKSINDELSEKNSKLIAVLSKLKEHLETTNTENAKLLYTNRTLSSDSLNERQKNKIVEAITSANSVEEAKVIFETLQSTVGSTDTKQPKSLSEAIERASSLSLPRRRETTKREDPAVNRWKLLAGLKNNNNT
tara:strand:- start:417 stop:1493 length:1077 start_codon:yes stop_codon:yes gene_type:complete